MIRTLLWLLGGVLLGGIIHIIVVLTLPTLAEDTVWSRIEALNATNRVMVLPSVQSGQPNPLGLDPDLAYGICQLDLSEGPAYVSGILPDAFWSVALFNEQGIVAYSTTNRDGIGQTLAMGIFNAAQTRLLAQQQIDIEEGLLVVEATSDKLAVLVRLAPPHQAMRARFEEALSQVQCGTRPLPLTIQNLPPILPGMSKRIFKDTGTHLPDYCRPTGDILARLGDKWVVPIFGHLKDGPLRFSELGEQISGISERMLTMTLRGLERDGLVVRSVLPTAPPRVEYALSERGQGLLPALLGLHAWAEANNAGIEQSRRDYDAAASIAESA